MKIGKDIYYQMYISILKYKIHKAKEDNKAFELSFKVLLNNVKHFAPYIVQNVTTDYLIMLINPPSTIKGRMAERFVHNNVLYTKADFEYHFLRYRKAFKVHAKHKEYIKELESKLITFKLYSKIVKKFNLKIADLIVFHGYKFNLGYSLGSLFVGRSESKRKKVNWEISNANKAELIKKGLTPALKADAQEAKKLGLPYDGRDWLVYHDPESVWIKHESSVVTSYVFQLIKSNISRSLRFYLSKLRASDTFDPKIYPFVEY